jgi:hypothetical protein
VSAIHIADTGFFVALGDSSNERYQRVRTFAKRNEIVLIDRMEPISDSIVAGSVVRLGNLFPDGCLANSSTGDDRPDAPGRGANPRSLAEEDR